MPLILVNLYTIGPLGGKPEDNYKNQANLTFPPEAVSPVLINTDWIVGNVTGITPYDVDSNAFIQVQPPNEAGFSAVLEERLSDLATLISDGAGGGGHKEVVSNKVTSFTSPGDNEEYPSTSAVVEYADALVEDALVEVLRTSRAAVAGVITVNYPPALTIAASDVITVNMKTAFGTAAAFGPVHSFSPGGSSGTLTWYDAALAVETGHTSTYEVVVLKKISLLPS